MAAPTPIVFLLLTLVLAPVRGDNFKVIEAVLLAGQSNMSGRGGVSNGVWDGVVPAECEYPEGSVLKLSRDLQWVEAQEPLHEGLDEGTMGVGPGLVFGATVARSRKLRQAAALGLVPCAIGGSGMRDWEKGQPLYEIMVRRAKATLSSGSRVTALLWYQGEADSSSPEEAQLYQHRLEKMITDLRADLYLKYLPVFIVGITMRNASPTYHAVREAQLSVVRTLRNTVFVDAEGLDLGPDGLHLTTTGATQLGLKLAQAYIQYAIPLFS